MNDAVNWHQAIAPRFAGRYADGKRFRERFEVWHDLIEHYCAPISTALDLGCGSGVFSELLASRARKVVAIDGSPAMLDIARRAIRDKGLANIELMEARLEDFGAKVKEGFDLVVCSSVIEYLEHPEEFLKTCRSKLNGGGYLLISMPNGSSVYRYLERVLYALSGYPKYYRFVKRVETPEVSARRLEEAGFTLVESRFFSAAPGISSLFRGLGGSRYSDTLVVFVARKAVGANPARHKD
jgi:2-polyprenyl-3-methyl-5-hydroxy-6-metoxy-1,4-benzoquinol methylase